VSLKKSSVFSVLDLNGKILLWVDFLNEIALIFHSVSTMTARVVGECEKGQEIEAVALIFKAQES